MPDNELPQSNIILYQTEDGRTRIQCRFENETLWLTQALIGELFQKDVRTINEHLVNIFAEGELSREATIRKFRIVRLESTREVAREIEHYSLPTILAVGYRVLADAQPRPVDADFGQAAKQFQKLPRPKKPKRTLTRRRGERGGGGHERA